MLMFDFSKSARVYVFVNTHDLRLLLGFSGSHDPLGVVIITKDSEHAASNFSFNRAGNAQSVRLRVLNIHMAFYAVHAARATDDAAARPGRD
jgi:hypothetical protein